MELANIQKLVLDEKVVLEVLGRIGGAVLAIVVGILVVRYVDRLVQAGMARLIDLRASKLSDSERQRAEVRKHTLTSIAHHGLVWVGYLIITLMALNSVGLDIRPVLATAGVASLAIGFGAQNLVKDVISGFFIILEDQYGQGDTVNLDGDEGVVENLNLRTTLLRNASGTLIIKTNGSIQVVRNMSKDWSRVDFRIGVSYDADLSKVLRIMEQEGQVLRQEFPTEILDRPEVLGVESFNESDVTLRMWIRCKAGQQFSLRRRLNRRIKERFDQEGIEIPFPQRVLWTKSTQASE